MRIARSSSTALLVVAVLLALIGGVIISPDGRLLSLSVGGLFALAVLFFGPSLVRRIIAILILLAVVLQIVPAYRQYGSFREHQGDRAKQGQQRQGSNN